MKSSLCVPEIQHCSPEIPSYKEDIYKYKSCLIFLHANFGSYKSRISVVQSSQSRGTGQYKNCVLYDFKFTSIYSASFKKVSTVIFIHERSSLTLNSLLESTNVSALASRLCNSICHTGLKYI